MQTLLQAGLIDIGDNNELLGNIEQLIATFELNLRTTTH